MIVIDYDKCCWKEGACTECGCFGGGGGCCDGCAEACPVEAITRQDRVVIDADACTDCSACVDACEHDALTLE